MCERGATDNLKAGVTKACFYDPAINRTYADLAAHYDTAFASGPEPVALPWAHCPRGRTNQRIKQRSRARFCWLNAGCRAGSAPIGSEAHLWCATARLRNRQFFSLGEVNPAIRPLLDRLNDKVTHHLGASRKQLFTQLDKPALKPLPVAPYVFAEWKKCRAGLDYHIAIDKHYYTSRLSE